MSRMIRFARAGGPEVLEFIEAQVPPPGPNQVRIKVMAIGINRAEVPPLTARRGASRRPQ